MRNIEVGFRDFYIVFDTLYRGKNNRHVVVAREGNKPIADFRTYGEAFNFTMFVQEPIIASIIPDHFVRDKVNNVGKFLIIRTVRRKPRGNLAWTYIITNRAGDETILTVENYKEAFAAAVRLSMKVME